VSTKTGQNTDTNWQVVVNDGGATATTTSTPGFAFTVGNEYEMWITMTAGATSIGWEIHDITAGDVRVRTPSQPTCPARPPRSTRRSHIRTLDAVSPNDAGQAASTSKRTRGNRMTVTTIRTATGFAQLGDDGTATLLDLTRQPTGQTRPLTADEAALVTAVLAQSTATDRRGQRGHHHHPVGTAPHRPHRRSSPAHKPPCRTTPSDPSAKPSATSNPRSRHSPASTGCRPAG
jgi:hypothetical protein